MNMDATTSATVKNDTATDLVASGSIKPHRTPGTRAAQGNMKRRKAKLEAERWSTEVTAKSVRCAACGILIQLHKHGMFYGTNWFKHKELCTTIKQIEAQEAEVSAIQLFTSIQHMIRC